MPPYEKLLSWHTHLCRVGAPVGAGVTGARDGVVLGCDDGTDDASILGVVVGSADGSDDACTVGVVLGVVLWVAVGVLLGVAL